MINDPSSERNYCYLTKKLPVHKSAKVKKGKIPDLVLDNILSDNDSDDDDYDDDNDSSENDDNSEDSENDDNSETMMRRRSISLQQISIMMNQNFLILTLIIIIHGLYCGYYNINNDINFPMLQ